MMLAVAVTMLLVLTKASLFCTTDLPATDLFFLLLSLLLCCSSPAFTIPISFYHTATAFGLLSSRHCIIPLNLTHATTVPNLNGSSISTITCPAVSDGQLQTSQHSNAFVPPVDDSLTDHSTGPVHLPGGLFYGCPFGGVELAGRLHEKQVCRQGQVQTTENVYACYLQMHTAYLRFSYDYVLHKFTPILTLFSHMEIKNALSC